MYRVVRAPLSRDSGELYTREQLVLLVQGRGMVMELAHSIPVAGHLGKHKTMDRVQQRFYWPTLCKDVSDYCRRCEATSRAKPRHAPLIPLPIMDEPFQMIAMDIVGPLALGISTCWSFVTMPQGIPRQYRSPHFWLNIYIFCR